MKAEEKRRIIYTVLSEYIGGDELLMVMCRWQDDYSDKSQFELNAFLSDCRDVGAIAASRAEIYRHLIGRFMKKSGDLLADPILKMNDYRQRLTDDDFGAGSLKRDDDWSIIFSQVVSGIFSQLRSDTARMVKAYCVEQSAAHRIHKEFIYRISLWQPDTLLDTAGIPLKQLRQVLNFIYIGVCEGLGPVEADRILSLAVRSVSERRRSGQLEGPDPGQLLQL